jgi:hypothetical protein
MLDSFKEKIFGELKDLESDAFIEALDKALKDNLEIGLADCAQALSTSLSERYEELLDDIINLSPYGDYDKITEDKEVITKFIKEEAVKPENWRIQFIEEKEKGKLLELVFFNKSIDDGDLLKGFVFLGLSGKIRHVFTQIHT